jgi:hypothetical protein
MKLTADRPFADHGKGRVSAWRSATQPRQFRTRASTLRRSTTSSCLKEGGTPAEYSAALAYTIAKGWLWKHESGTYVKFTPAGADLFT